MLVQLAHQRQQAIQEAELRSLAAKLGPLFGIVGVTTTEQSPPGPVECKARNPVPIKTMMNLLGMPAGPCRRPLGKMTRPGFEVVRNAALQVWQNDPTLLAPIAEAFGVAIALDIVMAFGVAIG